MASAPGLDEAQRWLQQAILGPREGQRAQLLAPAARLAPAQCLDVYRGGYRLRLLEAMRGLHSGLRALLGEEVFDDFAVDYLDARPSRSYTLFELDRHFADFLADHRPDRERPADRREAWIDVVIDLARYERAFAEVYDGPGTEAVRDSHAVPPGEVRPAPCLRLLTLSAPVHTYAAAVRRGLEPAPPAPRPVRLALSRRNYIVTATELDQAAHQFLTLLREGRPVRTAAAAAGLDEEGTARLLHRWTADGWLLTDTTHPTPESRRRTP
ncbi:HvfC/BufC N-terminal domain-containing protein [Streptomyces cahuitamycinicus]|uniref:HvfC/BufC N-terminal domain-containing protein n=1 Tax=Streptomyces cahuitamycinicus TaxID=2070367 RepID=UPI0015E0FAB3|nr:DNA-binding domain-containing protein [Streptomyces cahuitamycinicus]